MSGFLWRRYTSRRALLFNLWESSGGICRLCGLKVDYQINRAINRNLWPTIDHIVPRSKGGNHDLSNLQIAHYWCNNQRGDIDLETWDRSKLKPLPKNNPPIGCWINKKKKNSYIKISAENLALCGFAVPFKESIDSVIAKKVDQEDDNNN